MVSSVAPIKAKKLRYYADTNFKRRVLPPPVLAAGRYADVPPSRADDWSGLAIPAVPAAPATAPTDGLEDRKSTRLNSSHSQISYAVFCLKKKKTSTRSTAPAMSFDLPFWPVA